MAVSSNEITFVFDSNIKSVSCIDAKGSNFTWSVSGQTYTIYQSGDQKFIIQFNEGYILNTVENTEGFFYIKDKADTDFTAEIDGYIGTVTLTSKSSTPRKSVDLTILAGWEALAAKTYDITVVAKADGFKNSAPSAAVQVEKAGEVYTDCLTFTGETSEFTLKATNKEWDGTVEYSTDHNTWTTWDGTEISSSGQKLYLRGSGNTTFYTSKGAYLSLSARAACSGNIQTLLEYSNPPAAVPINCYRNMFRDCTSLTTTPALPATTLASGCYQYMFNGCTSLTTTPALPATTLADFCYQYMFNGCTSLTTAPELPATTLAVYCYRNMFNGCTSLKISAAQSSEYSTAWRIPSSGTISSTVMYWNTNMLSNTGGTFTSNPDINTTYYGAWSK